jgi:hypothetical protein
VGRSAHGLRLASGVVGVTAQSKPFAIHFPHAESRRRGRRARPPFVCAWGCNPIQQMLADQDCRPKVSRVEKRCASRCPATWTSLARPRCFVRELQPIPRCAAGARARARRLAWSASAVWVTWA